MEVSFLFPFVLFFSPYLREENVKDLIFQNHQSYFLCCIIKPGYLSPILPLIKLFKFLNILTVLFMA